MQKHINIGILVKKLIQPRYLTELRLIQTTEWNNEVLRILWLRLHNYYYNWTKTYDDVARSEFISEKF